MRWIHTMPHSAKVIPLIPFRSGTKKEMMNHDFTIIDFNLCVSIILLSAKPQPTWTEVGAVLRHRAILVNLGPEAFVGSDWMFGILVGQTSNHSRRTLLSQ